MAKNGYDKTNTYYWPLGECNKHKSFLIKIGCFKNKISKNKEVFYNDGTFKEFRKYFEEAVIKMDPGELLKDLLTIPKRAKLLWIHLRMDEYMKNQKNEQNKNKNKKQNKNKKKKEADKEEQEDEENENDDTNKKATYTKAEKARIVVEWIKAFRLSHKGLVSKELKRINS